MPKRMLRDWTDSEVIDKLSVKAEVFFTRLIMKTDDFGIYHANTKLLKANLYPLRETMRPSDITPLLAECADAGLLGTYTVAGKEYLVILNFGQRLRTSSSKFPEPPEDQFIFKDGSYFLNSVSNSRTNVRNVRPEEEVEVEEEVEGEGERQQAADIHPPEVLEAFEKFRKWIEYNTPNVLKIKKQIDINGYVKLKKAVNGDMRIVTEKLEFLHNTPKYFSGSTRKEDVFLTIKNWIRRDG